MEKTGDNQYVVTKIEGKLILRLPGGQEIPYDYRFPNCPPLSEGGSFVTFVE